MPRAVIAVVAGLVVGALFVSANVVALRDPTPHDAPVLAAGVASARVQAVLDRAKPGELRVRGVPAPLDATMGVEDRRAYGALVLQGSHATVLVAGANGVGATQIVAGALARAAHALGAPGRARVHDVVPLQPGDPRGLALQQIVLGTIMGGFLMGVVSSQLALAEALDVRLVAYVVFALAFGGLAGLVLDPVVGALRGDFLAIWVWVGVTAFVVSTGVAAAARLVGQAGILVAMALFLVLGNPSAGASAPTAFLPGLFRTVGPWLPPNAEANGLLGSTYFDAGVLREALVLALWALLAVGILVVLDSLRGPRSPLAYGAAAAAADEPAAAG